MERQLKDLSFLSVHIVKQKQTKICGFYKKYFVKFQNFQNSNFVSSKCLKIRSSINSWGPVSSHKNVGPGRFSRFDVYWDTNRKTNR